MAYDTTVIIIFIIFIISLFSRNNRSVASSCFGIHVCFCLSLFPPHQFSCVLDHTLPLHCCLHSGKHIFFKSELSNMDLEKHGTSVVLYSTDGHSWQLRSSPRTSFLHLPNPPFPALPAGQTHQSEQEKSGDSCCQS